MGLKTAVLAFLFHHLCFGEQAEWSDGGHAGLGLELDSSARFFQRMRSQLDLKDKSLLDVGCGTGGVCIEAARRGAARIVGVDIQPSRITAARKHLVGDYPQFVGIVEFRHTAGGLHELGNQRFDVVLSKDGFEHYQDPAAILATMLDRVRPAGVIAIGFAPMWKSPRGGHIHYFTKLPWAHLIFPEDVIMAERRRRFNPPDNAFRFADIAGGLNKMTLAKFETLMLSSRLECLYLATNVSSNPIVKLMRLASSIPPAREFLTTSIYGIWRAPSPEVEHPLE
jgi:SAM-dependent methyltransferase